MACKRTFKKEIIFGTVNGDIVVQKLDLRSTAKIHGDISTQTIEVEFGAVYNGKVKMTETGNQSASQKMNVLKEETVSV